ncbi:MAG: V-type ATP synthase subunit I [Candidatus Aenigmarchaeota archaeon]|nr:V-type ATP synthase subunit I [Candidatus Aenigmarchaeota archaeon]
MLTPEGMVKIRILGSKSQMKKVINELYGLKLLHLTEFRPAENFDIGKPFKEADLYSKHLVKLRSMVSFLKIGGEGKKIPAKANLKKLQKIERVFEKMSAGLEKLNERKAKLGQIILNPISRIATESDKIEQAKSLKTFIGVAGKGFIDELERSGLSYDLMKEIVGNKAAVILTVPTKSAKSAADMLVKYSFEERHLPETRYEEAIAELEQVDKKILQIKAEFGQFRKYNESLILNMEHSFTELIEKTEAPLSFVTSKRTFAAEGWVPKDTYEALEKRISNAASDKVNIEVLETEEAPPVKLDNPKVAQPFEELLKMYSYPKNYEFDPTIILLFTFSLFFGFMLGDIGYGLVLLSLSAFLFFKLKGALKSIAYIAMFSSVSAIIFGIVFGEFFGLEIIRPVIHRAEEIQTMIIVSIIFGLVHISAGLILGFITKYKEHGLPHAIFEKGSWLLIEFAAAALTLGILMKFQALTYSGAALMVAGILMLLKGEGIKGIAELPGLLSNILSYMRLFAIGLASVSLAVVVNELGVKMLESGGIWFVPAIFVFLIGHTVNIILGISGPFLQSLRLHYFEFFAKFLEGGGRQYFPFGKIKKWR